MVDKQKILVVDDDPGVTKAINRVLVSKGYEVIELNDPVKVEDYLLYSDFNLVITDLKMPSRDGLEVLRIVRQSKPNVPVIILTAHGAFETAVEAGKLGAAEYLTKPLKKKYLLDAVHKHANPDLALPDNIKKLIGSKEFENWQRRDKELDLLQLKNEIISTDTIPDGFAEIAFEEVIPGEAIPFDLFIQIYTSKKKNKFFLSRLIKKNAVYTTGLRNILFKKGLRSVYIRDEDYRDYLKYFTTHKSMPIFREDKIRDKEKLVLYGKAIEAIQVILTDPVDDKSIKEAVDLVDSIFRRMVKNPDTYRDMFKLFNQNAGIFNHSANVCLLTVLFGLYLGLKQKRVNILGLGAMFHDVGLKDIDKKILEKPGPLNDAEWREITKHPERGFKIFESSTSFSGSAARIILEHHEETDGSGYPKGLKGDQIDELSHLCRIVDKFDGLITKKPYQGALTPPQALKRIYLKESSVDKKVVIRNFIEFLGGKKRGNVPS